MGAADGAFVLSKEKQTYNNATLDVAGRDQQDMKIHLVRDAEKLIWNFEKSETELWKEPPEPLLEKLLQLFCRKVKCGKAQLLNSVKFSEKMLNQMFFH